VRPFIVRKPSAEMPARPGALDARPRADGVRSELHPRHFYRLGCAYITCKAAGNWPQPDEAVPARCPGMAHDADVNAHHPQVDADYAWAGSSGAATR